MCAITFFSFTVVASYEATKKHTFLVFFIFTFINSLILLGILVLYPKLGKTQRIFKSYEEEEDISTEKGENRDETGEDSNELMKLSADIGN